LIESSLRSARLQDLLKVGPARLLATMLGDLGVSTLCSIQDHDSVFFSFLEHQTSHVACFNARDYSTSASSMPSCFPRRTDLLGNPFLITSLLDLPFLLFFFGPSNQPCCLLQCPRTTLRVHLRRPLVFLVVPTCWETRFSSRRYSTYFFFSSFLDHHTDHPACHDPQILLMSASSMPSEFFHRCFDLLEACFL
jgi:hypothetical protein